LQIFQNDGLKWINNIKALKSKLRVRVDPKSVEIGYGEEAYYALSL